jgi:hypothetical protein
LGLTEPNSLLLSFWLLLVLSMLKSIVVFGKDKLLIIDPPDGIL